MVASLAAGSAPAEAHLGTVAGYLVAQGFTLVAALWGVLLWREFKGADLRVKTLAVFMFLLFASGLLVISQAAVYVRAA
jgi:glucose uptake protein